MNTYFIQNLETFECSMIFGLTFVDAMCRANLCIGEWICYAQVYED